MKYLNISLFVIFFVNLVSLQAQLSVTSEREDQIYQAGEEMNFLITSEVTREVSYKIFFDTRAAVIETGKVNVEAGQPVYIPFTLNEPGTVILEASDGNNTPKQLGVAFSPFEIGIYEKCPDDFDEFWSDQISQLSTIPTDPELTILNTGADNVTYRINLAGVDNRRIYGYITIPNGTGPFPAILTLPPAGTAVGVVNPEEVISTKVGAISLTISIHNAEPDMVDPNADQPNDITVREGYYYRTSILAGIRAIDYIFSRPEFDGENLVVTGVSQGGGLGMAVASLDTRVKALTISNPALCEHSGFKYNRASGFPYYNWSGAMQNVENINEDVNEASKYYDTKYFAQRYDRPCLFTTGYRDLVCPTTTVFGATNQLRGPTLVVHALSLEHMSPVEYWDGRFGFWIRHAPVFANSLFSENTPKSQLANAGTDTNGTVNQSIPISGTTFDNDGVVTNWPSRWSLVEGPGKAAFNDATRRNATVRFDQPGTYVLRFSAEDNAALSDNILITVVDYVTITVN